MTATEETYRQLHADPDEQLILNALLAAEGEFVSGSRLAEQIGVSRPAIKGKLEKLRAAGFDFEAVRNRGYRLTQLPTILHPGLLSYHQQTLAGAMEVLYFPAIDSTNSEAERRVSYGQPSPFAVVSSCQTKGRGRLRRDWYSASADNLYLSVVFEPMVPAQQLQHFTLWAGIHICRVLQAFVPKAPLKIKWPNDLHCGGRKFAGMLTEAKMDADGLKTLVFGIGININSNPMDFPPELRSLATSLYALHGEELPINRITAEVIHAIQRAYEVCLGDAPNPALTEAWAPLDSLQGQWVSAQIGEREVSGIASGIDAQGALLIDGAAGLQSIHAGDVRIQKAPATTRDTTHTG